jgi:hypothetical protein
MVWPESEKLLGLQAHIVLEGLRTPPCSADEDP